MRLVKAQRPLISVIVCAHNEERYVDQCLPHLIRALDNFPNEIIFVADRCTDLTVKKAKKYKVKVIEKQWKRWKNSYAESLQAGYLKARGSFLSILDVDVVVPRNLFRDLLPLLKGRLTSVAASVVTYPDTFWNRVTNAWEKTYGVAPLGREPYGAARLLPKKVMDEIGGFRDVPSPDTDIDLRLFGRGYRSVAVPAVKVYHIRHVSPKTMVNGQLSNGRGRYALSVSFPRTLAHAIFRFRPFIVGGWLLEWQRTVQTR